MAVTNFFSLSFFADCLFGRWDMVAFTCTLNEYSSLDNTALPSSSQAQDEGNSTVFEVIQKKKKQRKFNRSFSPHYREKEKEYHLGKVMS